MLKTRANQKPLVIPKDIYGAIALMCVKIKKGDSLKMVDVSGSQRSDGNIVKKAPAEIKKKKVEKKKAALAEKKKWIAAPRRGGRERKQTERYGFSKK